MVHMPLEFFRLTLIGAVLAAFLAPPALAAPRSIGDCEAIRDADAYNACLASFGPVAHTGPTVGETPAARGREAIVAPAGQYGARRRGRRDRNAARYSSIRRQGGLVVLRREGGRVRTTIDVRRR